MRAGAQVIYQATFFDGTWRGHADFLHRIEEPSLLGAWSYEVADTKLARKAKAGALLQMCVYSDLLAQVQGVEPPWMEVALGGSARAIERFRVADYMAYYRRVRARFEALMARQSAGLPGDRHVPGTGRALRGLPLGRDVRPGNGGADDHLSLVAGITTRQRTAAGDASAWTPWRRWRSCPCPSGRRSTASATPALERVREQARLQVEGRREDRVLFELLEPDRGAARPGAAAASRRRATCSSTSRVTRSWRRAARTASSTCSASSSRRRAAARLPRRSGAPTAAAEKRAFEDVHRLRDGTLARGPEPAHLPLRRVRAEPRQALMGLHATREDEVDRLLRGERVRGPVSGRPAGRAGVAGELLHQEARAALRPDARGRPAGRRLEHRQLRAVAGRRPGQTRTCSTSSRPTTGTTASPTSSCATGWRRGART